MSEFLFHYERVDPTTWVYLSSLLTLGLFFKFNRFWSVRNLDLVLLILLAPGLLLIQESRAQQRAELVATLKNDQLSVLAGPIDSDEDMEQVRSPETEEALSAAQAKYARMQRVEWAGFLWLMVVGGLLVIRLLIDPNMARRPLLEPNLTTGGLIFLCVSSFVFLMANVVTSAPAKLPTEAQQRMRMLLASDLGPAEAESLQIEESRGPGYALLTLFPQIPTTPLTAPDKPQEEGDWTETMEGVSSRQTALVPATRAIAMIAHLAIVLGIATVGYRHFDNLKTGVGAATLYLILPYTSQLTGYISHSIPAALLVWAVVFYRRPATAGVFLGLAIGCYYYPLFLLPLWISFYWQRGLLRFVGGVLAMLTVLVGLLLLQSASWGEFGENVRTMFGVWLPIMDGLEGVWGLGWDPWYRVPVLAAFIGTSCTLAIWPAQKNLGTLISCSGAVMVATQFWHGFGGGLYMGWYLPLLLLTIFRPNLEDRIALSVLGEGWFPRRSKKVAA